MSELLTTRDVADVARVDPATVRRWVASGLLRPTVTTPGGHMRFDRADVNRLLASGTPAAS